MGYPRMSVPALPVAVHDDKAIACCRVPWFVAGGLWLHTRQVGWLAFGFRLTSTQAFSLRSAEKKIRSR